MLTLLFDGIAYGMLLFVLAVGLAVTLGLMNFINLAHGAFAMAGGYVTLLLVNRAGLPFFAGLPIAFVATALIGALFERTLYVHVYSKSHLDQVLFTIGLVFMSVAAVDYIMGSSRIFIKLPAALEGQFDFFGVGIGVAAVISRALGDDSSQGATLFTVLDELGVLDLVGLESADAPNAQLNAVVALEEIARSGTRAPVSETMWARGRGLDTGAGFVTIASASLAGESSTSGG